MYLVPCSYDSWIYNYLCNQCLSPLMLGVRISIRARYATVCDKICEWLATGRWFSPSPHVSSTNKTDRHNIAAILLKVVVNTIKQTNNKHSFELFVPFFILSSKFSTNFSNATILFSSVSFWILLAWIPWIAQCMEIA